MQLWRYGRPIERLGQRYNLLGMLGSGGMADVCLAWDEVEHRQVAIKAIKPDELDQRALDRFVKEADQVAQWRHPHILRIYSDLKLELLDAAKGSIVPYMVMEYAQGGDLHKRLTPGKPFPLNKLLTVFPQLCSAVSYAHQRGVVHRDLKPLNILFRVLPSGEEQVVLSDFGLAVQMTTSQQTHAWGGTLPYMAPEQFEGRVLPASDIFALGVILYLLTTGHLPFQRSLRTLVDYRAGQDGQATSAIMYPPVPPSQHQPALSLAFDAVIARALNEEPGQRYTDALQLWEEASIALYDPEMLVPTTVRSHNPRTRRSRASGYSTASMPQPPSDLAASVAPAVSPPPATIDTGHDEHGSYISTDGDIAAATSLARRLPSTPSRSGGVPRDIEEIRLPSTPPHSRGSASTSRSQPPHSGRNNRPGLPMPGEPLHRPARKNRVIFVGLLALLLLAFVGGSIFYLPTLHNVLPAGTPLLSNAVDVTIMPTSRTLSQAYQLTAITGNVDGAQMQVQARTVNAPAQSQQKSANATGARKTAGSQAKGTLTFFNGSFASPFTVSSGTTVTGNDGISVVTDASVAVPPANSGLGTEGTATVPAHATDVGLKGNIAAQDINKACCINNNSVFARNMNPFTGGQDPKNYAFMQQSDVDAVANPLKGVLGQQGLSALRGQIGANEQPVKPLGANDCTTNVSSDQAIGDTGANVTTANVTVAVTCAVEVYDNAAARAIVARQLTARAMTTLGAGYVLRAGRAIQQDITVQGVDQQRTVALSVQARGTWIFRFSDAQRQALAHQIAGKSRADALALLQQSTGVASVNIPTRVTALPGDVNRINIVVNG